MGHPRFDFLMDLCALCATTPFPTPTNKKPFVGDPGFALKPRKNGARIVLAPKCSLMGCGVI
ncbi:hypothetical protein AciPR4_0104 [Terriglobus saanensis SP1PR4]|uniref:Uncharacterized protein n=1 Tax=Terriglobus saanensis (strain ATCC BAA-1853 / DSM 23119 / SP1PR4) TaxID=401053 RepID=E8UZ00_TERSS|nr:hypothetical protein AciPR4_0104 [Terriglobus saanensis SP1PR4]